MFGLRTLNDPEKFTRKHSFSCRKMFIFRWNIVWPIKWIAYDLGGIIVATQDFAYCKVLNWIFQFSVD